MHFNLQQHLRLPNAFRRSDERKSRGVGSLLGVSGWLGMAAAKSERNGRCHGGRLLGLIFSVALGDSGQRMSARLPSWK